MAVCGMIRKVILKEGEKIVSKLFSIVGYFLRRFTYYKFNFIFTLLIPAIMMVQMSRSISGEVSLALYYEWVPIILSYMVGLNAMQVGSQLVAHRKERFLKQFLFITGNIHTIIFARILAQFLVLLATTVMMIVAAAMVFSLPITPTLVYAVGFISITFWPVTSLFLLFNAVQMHEENLMTVSSVLTFILITLVNFISLTDSLSLFVIILSPMHYIIELGKVWSQLFLSGLKINFSAVIIGFVLYIGIGFVAIKNFKVMPIYRN